MTDLIVPRQSAAVDPQAIPPSVVSGTPIASSWGNAVVDELARQESAHQGGINSLNAALYNRYSRVAQGYNTYEIPTTANAWSDYGITSFTIPSNGLIYLLLLTVGIQARSDAGGYIRAVTTTNGVQVANSGEMRAQCVSNETVPIVHQAYMRTGGGALAVGISVLTQNAGFMGPAWASVVMVPE